MVNPPKTAAPTNAGLPDVAPAAKEPAAKENNDSGARVKDALLRTGVLQNAILTSATFAIIATDENGIIQILNPGAERMLGYEAKEVVNIMRPSDLSDPADIRARVDALTLEFGVSLAPGFEALAFKAARGLEDISERTWICKDGSRLPTILSITALRNDQGAIIGYLLTGTDNAARKRAEELLHLAVTTAEAASRAKSDFLSSMSHELRTPLNAILGFAQLVESGVPLPTPAQKRSLDQITKAGWYLLELINEILDLAIIESGRLTVSAEPVSLSEVLSECQAMVEPQGRQRGLVMTFPLFETPLFVRADRTRVKQILINLLHNAIKYNQPSGAVAVEVAPRPGNMVRIGVRDTGHGLAPEQLAQLFQPFNRIGKEAGGEEGTGIGLVVTKRLAELMGGTIGVESVVGAGSLFWIELRAAIAPPKRKTDLPVSPGSTALGGAAVRTVLYVEDNPANLELVEQIIARRADLRLLSVADGSLGVEYARNYLPDVVLMDINLAGISGVEAMKILRLDPKTAHIPVIAVSANATPRDIARSLEAGFVAYITKPIQIPRFMEVLDAALSTAPMASSLAAHDHEKERA